MEERVELRAMKVAEDYFRQDGWEVVNVSRVRGEHGGYDLFLKNDIKNLRVEVKGCTRLYQIPDHYHTEFDSEKKLVADILCVVYFLEMNEPRIALIPREAISPEYVIPKYGYRISGRFKNEKILSKFFVN